MSRVRNLRRHLYLAPILALTATAAGAQPRLYTWDFDDGTLQGWSATGAAFVNQPTFGNNVVVRRPGESPGQDGNYWIGSYENHPNNASPPGPVQGDEPQGMLVSPSFRIDGRAISFLIGGGNDRNAEFVGLLVKSRPGIPPPPSPDLVYRMADGAYQLTLVTTGRNDEHMMRTIWDVHEFAGETARIIAVDRSSAPWGHINLDSVNLPWASPSGSGLGTAVPVSGLGTAVPVDPSQPVTAYPVGGGTIIVQPPAQGVPQARAVGGGPVVVMPPAIGSGPVYAEPPLPQVQRDPGSPPGPDASGHFQLIALQFVADHQTRDDALESDGPGDEIQVRSDNLTFAPDGRFVRTESKTSGIFGAPDKWDFIAGRAVPGWSASAQVGGLMSGDIYPRSVRPVRTNGDLPMVLWDGVLQRGGDGVLIIPSLWEIEDRGVSRAQTAWDNALVRDRSLGLSIARALGNPVEDRESPVLDYLPGPTAVFDDGNRPIGAAVHIAHFPLPGAALPHDAGMRPQSIVLTYDKAMLFAARPATALELRPEPGTVVFDGLPVPRGGIVLHFVDPPGNDGDYYLITQLVQVP